MSAENKRFLRIHFAPATACIDLPLSEFQFDQFSKAMDAHSEKVTLEISSYKKIPVSTNLKKEL